MQRLLSLTVLILPIVMTAVLAAGDVRAPAGRQLPEAADLRPTAHPPLPADPSQYWLVPSPTWLQAAPEMLSAARDLARAASLVGAEKPAQALPLIRAAALAGTPLEGYAAYLQGLAEAGLNRNDRARQTFAALREARPAGFLYEAASLQLAEMTESQRDFAGAVAIYEDVLGQKPSAPDDLLLRLARAAAGAGNRRRALAAYQTLYYDWPTSEAAAAAQGEMPLADFEPLRPQTARFTRELERAERLFTARRYGPAREAFEPLVAHASGEAADLVSLRLAECDYFLRRYRRVRDDLRPFLLKGSRRAEASYFSLMTVRALGDRSEYRKLTRALVDEFPDSPWAEDALNNLASSYIVDNDDAKADEVFRELVARFPSGRYTPRASWKSGWWAYRRGAWAEAASLFERAAATFPRSDYRPAYLYWAGRARDKAGDRAACDARLQLAVIDYANSYFGRLASAQLTALGSSVPTGRDTLRAGASIGPARDAPLPTADLIRWLISIGMYDEALDEVQYAERTAGESTVLQATRAWLLNRKGELRPAITLMRQAYPQFLTAGGETLPPEVLQVIFPVDYWPLIRQHAELHKLDPYLLAALIAQESTFDKDATSSARAIGLMQIMPTTGRRLARRLGLRTYSTRKLTDAETNIRIGTSYFAGLLQQFGSVHLALIAYNAGETRVTKWTAERPGLPQDEFIDDIPFPETQNYVKRILGTAEDYRRIYGPAGGDARRAAAASRGGR